MNWNDIFDFWGSKEVSDTDKNKDAYVLSEEQVEAVEKSGRLPTPKAIRPAVPFSIALLLDPDNSVETSYYYAERSTSKRKRPPEPRFGRAFINRWLEVGDRVVIGSIGTSLFALKENKASEVDFDRLVETLAKHVPLNTLRAKATLAKKNPDKKRSERWEYPRNPFIVASALSRASNQCEAPKCKFPTPFFKAPGHIYLEVHHIVPLSEKGLDELKNVAAICPNCHRELHHGINKDKKREELRIYVESLP